MIRTFLECWWGALCFMSARMVTRKCLSTTANSQSESHQLVPPVQSVTMSGVLSGFVLFMGDVCDVCVIREVAFDIG